MEFVRHESRLNRPVEGATDGCTQRAHLRKLARTGNAGAIQALTPPPFPEPLDYLHDWAIQLHGRSGAGMGGLLPLSHQEIRAWRENMNIDPTPYEVDALIQIDAAMLYPEGLEEPDDG